jgi:hypothetical protein
MGECLPFVAVGAEKVANMVTSIIVVLGVQIPMLGESAWLAIISSHMMVVIALAA